MMTVAGRRGPEELNGDGWHRPELWWHTDSEWWLHILPRAPPFIISMGRKRSTKAGRSALSLPSNDICSWRQPHYRSSFTSLSLHLSPSIRWSFSLLFSPTLSPPQLSATLSEEGIQRSDNEIMTHPFQPFKSQPFYFPPTPPILCCSFILNPFFIDLLIFSCSYASDAAEEAAGLVHLFAG